MSYKGRFQHSKKGAALRRALTAVACVVAVLIGIITAGYFYLDSKLNKITQAELIEKDTTDKDLSALIGNLDETEPSEQTEPESEPEVVSVQAGAPDYGKTGKIINILVVGQDYRAGEDHKLADSIILFTMNKETRTLTLTSFLRDSYVKLPEYYRGHTCGWNRINTSYALGYAWFGDAGAMEMINLTIEHNYGVHIDGNIEVGFDTFTTIIDALGGLELELVGDEFALMEREHKLFKRPGTLHEGVNLVNGEIVLSYVRERHFNDDDNDMNRAARQRMVIGKILDKCKSMNLLELNDLIDQVLPQIITNISTDDMKVYIKELLPYLFDLTIESNQCPANGTYRGEMVDLPDGPGGVLKIEFYPNRVLLKEICYDPEEAEEARQP